MQKIIRIAAIAAAFVVTGAQAQVYVEGNIIPAKISGGIGFNSDPKPTAFSGIVGYDLHPNLAVEGVLGFGLKNGSSTATESGVTSNVDVKIKSTYGFYLKPRYQINNDIELFARIGYLQSKLEATVSVGGVSASDTASEGSTAWGLGGNYAIDKNLYLTAGYNQLYKKDGVKLTGFNFGVGYKF